MACRAYYQQHYDSSTSLARRRRLGNRSATAYGVVDNDDDVDEDEDDDEDDDHDGCDEDNCDDENVRLGEGVSTRRGRSTSTFLSNGAEGDDDDDENNDGAVSPKEV